MKYILKKEMRLSASILSYLFIFFGLMFFLPGYPIICSVLFVSLGIFQSFQNARETNDIVFSVLLPIRKIDVVKGKFIFSCFIELCSIILMTIATLIRMTALKDVKVYQDNALMNANLFALGIALFAFGIFNLVFICGFFKTSYKLGKPFITYFICAFVIIEISESLHHIPNLESLNAFGADHFTLQLTLLGVGALLYILLTALSYHRACLYFENVDL